jgi:hypothetical protein
MTTYQIYSTQGADFGTWTAETEAHALYLMHLEADVYGVHYDAGSDKITFTDAEMAELAGNVEDWTIEEIV